MKQLKFRIWDNENNTIINTDLNSYINIVNNKNTNANEVMLFTGFKDCNDIEIFEGDILYINEEIPHLKSTRKYGIVKFKSGTMCIGEQSIDYLVNDIFNEHRSIKILGNIYENKELIKYFKEEDLISFK